MGHIPTLDVAERLNSTLRLAWSDGTDHRISYADLQYWCPCASCSPQRDDDNESSERRKRIDMKAIGKPEIELVGRYGLKFNWQGACTTGMWTYERLWLLGDDGDPDQGRPYVHGPW